MARASLFGKRTLSLFLALLMLLSALPAALAEAPTDPDDLPFEDIPLPASSKDVDDSTESGRMLKEYMEWLEADANAEYGNNSEMETWEADPDAENGWIDGFTDLEVITIDLPMELVSEETLAQLGLSLDSLGVESLDELDGNGDGYVDTLYSTDIIKDAARSGLEGLLKGDPKSAMINWGIKTLTAYIFGDFDKPDKFDLLAKQIEQGFREINGKLDAIKKQIDKVLDLLKKVIQQMTLDKYKADLNDTANQRDLLKSIRDITRISLNDAGRDAKKRQSALEAFHKWPTDGNIYVATAKLGQRISRTDTNSGKNIFFIAHTLTNLLHLPWDHQQAIQEDVMRNAYLLVYLEQMAYCKLSLLWQIQKCKQQKKNNEINNLCAIYKFLFTGDRASSVISNTTIVLNALKAAPAYNENPSTGWYRFFKKGKLDLAFHRKTHFTEFYSMPLKWDIKGSQPSRPDIALHNTFRFFKGLMDAPDSHSHEIAPIERFDGLQKMYPKMDILEIMRQYAGVNAQPGYYWTNGRCYFKSGSKDALIYGDLYNPQDKTIKKDVLLFEYKNLNSSGEMRTIMNQNVKYLAFWVGEWVSKTPQTPVAVPLKGEVMGLRNDGFLLKPDEASLAAANEALKAQRDEYEAQKAEAEEAGAEYPSYTFPDSFTPNDDGLLRVQYLPDTDEGSSENSLPSDVTAMSEEEILADVSTEPATTPPEELPDVGDVVEVEAYNQGAFTEEQQANGYVNEDGGDFLFSTKLTVLENNYDSAMGTVSMLSEEALTLLDDEGQETAYLLTPDTKLDEGVAEGAYVRVTWKAEADQPADALVEPQTLVSVTLEEKPVTPLTAEGEVTMLGATTLTVMTDEGEKTFTITEAQVIGTLAEGAKVSVLYTEQAGELVAAMIDVEEEPVGPVEVLTVDGMATEISEEALTIDGSDGNAYTFDLTSATVEGDLEPDSPTTVVYYAEAEKLVAVRVLAEKPPVGPVVILTVEGVVTSVNEEVLGLTTDDGTEYAFELNGAKVYGEPEEGCTASVSYYQVDDQPTAVSVTVIENVVATDDGENVQE